MSPMPQKDGFTLLETIIAVTVLSLTVLLFTTLSNNTRKAKTEGDGMARAILLAQNRVEYVKTIRNTDTLNDVTEDYGSIPKFLNYKRTTMVERNVPDPGVRTITVSVFWNSGAGFCRLKTISSD